MMDASLPQAGRATPRALTSAPFLICQSSPDAVQTALVGLLDREEVLAGPVLSLSQARGALDQASDRLLVVLTRSPRRAVALALAAGASPEQALAQWMAEAVALLALRRLNRRQVILLQTGAALAHPDALAASLGLDAALARDIASLAAPGPDPVCACLAEVALSQSAKARALRDEFSAACQALTPDAAPDPVDVAAAAVQHGRQQRSAARNARTRDADSGQQARMQDEILSLYEQLRQASAAQAEKTAALAELRTRLETAPDAGTDPAARDAEIALYADQIRALQALLEEREAALQAAQAQSSAQGAELVRVTKDATELSQQQELLMSQLRAGQAALETQYTRNRKAEDSKTALASEKSALTSELAQLRSDLDRTRQERDAVQQKLAEVEQWIHGIMGSRSYRLMEPLRRLRLAAKPKDK
ncbi:hypothetical protein [Puniceibacterium confluentis]|uniref:hypothetical protein n=1 Tax=Puniceibacterium confluentis TaxID=1958944 RepID=UPI0011B800BF|nr:hypothetical protein [Puniceibacterium confluentis]